jgi:hypothetical protein
MVRLSTLALGIGLLALGSSVGAAPEDDSWVLQKPPKETQFEKKAAERGGINPCNTPDPGFGAYDAWSRDISLGNLLVPKDVSSTFDVMFHFHGHEAARKEWVRAVQKPVMVGIDLGTGSGAYDKGFASPRTFEDLVAEVEDAIGLRTNKTARVRRIGLSAWSAGYGAVTQILASKSASRIDTVILLDGLHSGYSHSGGTLNDGQLAPFARFAKEAAAGRKLMFVSHSSIIPPGYASTTETANYLIASLDGKPRASKPRTSDPWGLELVSWFLKSDFHVRGFAGNGKLDHCAHFGVYRDVLRYHVARRWR